MCAKTLSFPGGSWFGNLLNWVFWIDSECSELISECSELISECSELISECSELISECSELILEGILS